jgi:hypothetical protein
MYDTKVKPHEIFFMALCSSTASVLSTALCFLYVTLPYGPLSLYGPLLPPPTTRVDAKIAFLTFSR